MLLGGEDEVVSLLYPQVLMHLYYGSCKKLQGIFIFKMIIISYEKTQHVLKNMFLDLENNALKFHRNTTYYLHLKRFFSKYKRILFLGKILFCYLVHQPNRCGQIGGKAAPQNIWYLQIRRQRLNFVKGANHLRNKENEKQ